MGHRADSNGCRWERDVDDEGIKTDCQGVLGQYQGSKTDGKGVTADNPTLRGLCSPDVRHTRATVRCDTIITPRAVTDLLA
eukprot:70575-Prorocentrum_minimum.AAC.1